MNRTYGELVDVEREDHRRAGGGVRELRVRVGGRHGGRDRVEVVPEQLPGSRACIFFSFWLKLALMWINERDR